jgi:hypothetical protein
MHNRILLGMIAMAWLAGAQTFPRRAALTGGGDQRNGQCTVEVIVDGAAEVEIRGANGLLRNLSGQAPQWRRFECTGMLPQNPSDFRFMGVEGRGRQELVAAPQNGSAAVVRIEDPEAGASGYAFQLTWNGYPAGPDRAPTGARDDGAYRNDRRRPEEAYHRDRDAQVQGNEWRAMFFQHIREDLDHVTSGTFPFTGDRARLARTQMELDELQQKLSSGLYDQRELDEVIAAMQAVLQGNRLDPRDRAILADDLSRMRDFRVKHDEYGARDVEGTYHQEREQRFQGDNWRATFFQHIREDLDHVESNTFPFGGDQARLARTKNELDELQQKLAQGVFDERELDETMGALRQVVESNRLDPRDRDVLSDDLTRMREFRARHNEFGAR